MVCIIKYFSPTLNHDPFENDKEQLKAHSDGRKCFESACGCDNIEKILLMGIGLWLSW